MLAGHAFDRANQPALHDAGGWLTYAELGARTSRVSAGLRAEGVQPGDRVVLSGASCTDLAVVHFALLRSGAVVVPANGAYRERELAHIVGDARPVLAIADEPSLYSCRSLTVSQAATLDGPAIALDREGAEAPALIGYTSGTTGAPKGAVLSHGNLLASAAALAHAWRWIAADRLVLCLPLFHAHGLCVGLHGTVFNGASAVLLDGFEPQRVLDAIQQHNATMFFGVPTMYHRLVATPRAAEMRRLRLCVSGSAPLPPAVFDEFHALTGQRVLERYGMTETVMLISNPYDGPRKPGSVGHPLPGVEVRFDRPGGMVDVATAAVDGLEGEILVRGPNVFSGYWERPDANRDAFVDGFFRTGDVGLVAGDGAISIVGRAKELIISGGFNVYPREVEEELAALPGVAEAAVAGTPSPEWGEEVTAYLVMRPGQHAPSLDELRAGCRGRLANFKLPRRLVVVDSLPRNALGKVMKHELPR